MLGNALFIVGTQVQYSKIKFLVSIGFHYFCEFVIIQQNSDKTPGFGYLYDRQYYGKIF